MKFLPKNADKYTSDIGKGEKMKRVAGQPLYVEGLRGNNNYRMYAADPRKSNKKYISLFNKKNGNIWRSCRHERLWEVNNLRAVEHECDFNPKDLGYSIVVLQGEFSFIQADPGNFFAYRTDLLIHPSSCELLSCINEDFRYPLSPLYQQELIRHKRMMELTFSPKSYPNISKLLSDFVAILAENKEFAGFWQSVGGHSNPAEMFKWVGLEIGIKEETIWEGPKEKVFDLESLISSLKVHVFNKGAINLREAKRIFGITDLTGISLGDLKKTYRVAAANVHPDKYPSPELKEIATKEMSCLTQLFHLLKDKVQ
ncbi:MAG: J domain-containing protein [bacterium]|nr:J domain-containing protein [Candidatus Margulisiibacteriota bacterium]